MPEVPSQCHCVSISLCVRVCRTRVFIITIYDDAAVVVRARAQYLRTPVVVVDFVRVEIVKLNMILFGN